MVFEAQWKVEVPPSGMKRKYGCRKTARAMKKCNDFRNVLIGLSQQPDKLVFVGPAPDYLSLRDQSADWSWQSPG